MTCSKRPGEQVFVRGKVLFQGEPVEVSGYLWCDEHCQFLVSDALGRESNLSLGVRNKTEAVATLGQIKERESLRERETHLRGVNREKT